MKPSILRPALWGLALPLALVLSQAASAQLAPGSDPIILQGPVNYLALPVPPVRVSDGLDDAGNMPAWIEAKVSRYEAKAFAKLEGESGTVYTEKDVVSRQTGNALERTCTTEVASNTVAPGVGPSGSYGPGNNQEQIAVLRGDLITICR